MMMGHITLENGAEAVFFLSEEDVEILEREAAEARVMDAKLGYGIADELAEGAIPNWVKRLKTIQGRIQGREGETQLPGGRKT